MSNDNDSNPQRLWIQRLGSILAPPVATGLCLLTGFDLILVGLVTIAVVLPASLYNRRLLASTNNLPSDTQQGTLNEVLENRKNVVVYKTQEGPQIIAFYKVVHRPQDYSLHTLKVSFANVNLTLYPIIHTNGPFLAVRFSGESKNSQKQFIWDVPQHLDAFTHILMQKFPGLELVAAASKDVETLVTIFDIKKLTIKSTLAPDATASCQLDADQEEGSSLEPQISTENLRNLVRNSERAVKSFEKPLQQANAALNDPIKSREEMKTVTILPNENEEDLIPLIESFQKIIATIDSAQDRPNAVPITPTGKRIAGHLVVKDLKALLEILQNLKNLPINVQNKITACSAYLERKFGDSFDLHNINPSEELWIRIPGAVKLIESILEELLSAYETDFHQSDRTLQSA